MDKVDHVCSQHVTHMKCWGHRGTRREHPTQAPCSYLEGDVVLHLMDKVDHFYSQHVTHVKYGGHRDTRREYPLGPLALTSKVM